MPDEYGVNEYGTRVSKHVCETCGQEFTVCPAVEHKDGWKNCLSPSCPSYDPQRDVDLIFENVARLHQALGVENEDGSISVVKPLQEVAHEREK